MNQWLDRWDYPDGLSPSSQTYPGDGELISLDPYTDSRKN